MFLSDTDPLSMRAILLVCQKNLYVDVGGTRRRWCLWKSCC